MYRCCCAAAAAVALVASAAPAGAEPAPPPRPSALRRAAAITAAIVPGFVLRGAGSWVIGERRTARTLARTAVIGVGAMVVGGVAVGLSGGYDGLIIPGAPILLLGAGLALPTWLADIWVAAGGERVGLPRAAPPWSLELGATWLHSAYRERALGHVAAQLELGRLGLGARGMLDTAADAQDASIEARWRLRGPAATGEVVACGSRLGLRAAASVHRDTDDEVTLATLEAELVGRGDLAAFDPRLAGQFIELSTGLGVERASYPGGAHDLGSLLLGRFAWGVYLGRRGEAAIGYDHRRDSLAGGLAAFRASGFFGSFRADVALRVAGPWGVAAAVEVGSAWVSTLALRYHGGAR